MLRAWQRRAGSPIAHTSVNPAARASLTAGDLGQDRVDSWRALQRELAFQARRGDARLRAEESRTWKALSRANRAREDRP